jgi:hypothetical protein
MDLKAIDVIRLTRKHGLPRSPAEQLVRLRAAATNFCEATLHVLLCGAVLTHSDQHDRVERAVELSISRPVQAVPRDCPRGRLDGRGTAKRIRR